MKLLKWLTLGLLLLSLISAAVLWSWGRFAQRAVGAPSGALPTQDAQTALDRWVRPLLDTHPEQTGALLVSDSLQAFAARALSARQAERSLDVQYYLWHDDLTGRLLKDELMAAAERGVRVRMLIDDMNGLTLDDSLLAMDAHPNLEVRLFNPARNRDTAWRRALEMGLRFVSFNRRMHNKAWVADNRVALVGGRNIGNEYFDAADVNFHDADLMLIGPAVAQTSDIFDAFWNHTAVIPLAALHGASQRPFDLAAAREAWRAAAQGTAYANATLDDKHQPLALFQRQQHHWVKALRVLSDPPAKAGAVASRRAPERWLVFDVLQTLFSARTELRLISPYFVPGNMGTLLFTGLAEREVDVGILTNSLAANDVPAVHAGYRHYRQPLLEAGVQLWELKPGERGDGQGKPDGPKIAGSSGASLHTKAFVVDGTRGFVGSFNFDPRSASLNTEMGVLFDHPLLAQEVLRMFHHAKQPDTSYAVSLREDGGLQWQDPKQDRVWTHEPGTTWGLRTLTRVMSWLPIESQL
ncbi:MAG: phospholipase D family protein [Ottowia sp.]|nr:phospholipase D family protein [Ottowia sp.]